MGSRESTGWSQVSPDSTRRKSLPGAVPLGERQGRRDGITQNQPVGAAASKRADTQSGRKLGNVEKMLFLLKRVPVKDARETGCKIPQAPLVVRPRPSCTERHPHHSSNARSTSCDGALTTIPTPHTSLLGSCCVLFPILTWHLPPHCLEKFVYMGNSIIFELKKFTKLSNVCLKCVRNL